MKIVKKIEINMMDCIRRLLTPSARPRGCIKWCAIRQLLNN